MRSTEDVALNIVTLQTEFEQKMQALTPWQQFLVIMHIYGWPMRTIAEHAGITPQAVGYQYKKAKMLLGAQMTKLSSVKLKSGLVITTNSPIGRFVVVTKWERQRQVNVIYTLSTTARLLFDYKDIKDKTVLGTINLMKKYTVPSAKRFCDCVFSGPKGEFEISVLIRDGKNGYEERSVPKIKALAFLDEDFQVYLKENYE